MNASISRATFLRSNVATQRVTPNQEWRVHEGLQLQREFYSPPYDTPKPRESRWPDQRNVLFWMPQVMTKEGQQHLEIRSLKHGERSGNDHVWRFPYPFNKP